MTVTTTRAPAPPHSRPFLVDRRFGYLVGAAANAAVLYLVNAQPGWETFAFLTGESDRVLLAVNVAILAGLLVHLGYVIHDPRWLQGLGDMVITSLSLIAIVQLWTVFPFSFAGTEVDWGTIVRFLLAFGVVGTAIGFFSGLTTLLRHIGRD